MFIHPSRTLAKCQAAHFGDNEFSWHFTSSSVAFRLHVCLRSCLSMDLSSSSVWTASSEFGTYRLCEQRRFRRACASAQSRQNLRCSLIQAVSQEEPSDKKARSLAPLNVWACAVKICHDGILEDTNSLDGARMIMFKASSKTKSGLAPCNL